MNRSVSRILYLDVVETAIIHLGQSLPAGSSDLPGGRSSKISNLRSQKASGGQPCWRLPIWSCTARSLPGRACHHTRRCALTLSPKTGPHRFTHYPDEIGAGLFSVALVVDLKFLRPQFEIW